jgi:monoamine oxidase
VVVVGAGLAGRIDYMSALPAACNQLTHGLPIGAAIKCIVLYERRFWTEAGFSGEIIFDRGIVGYSIDGTKLGGAQPAPVGRIHWAGSETATEFFGAMEGALESGERASRELLARL